ncbi:RHS repeat-associated core domain-containing protein [Marinicella meishanensis]|uniref:RHS repeat-associated core domain-containing protein n=1 Tax=Marinicella meishanensis TaxID=2873263 RepID=UPI001CC1B8E9|nr:RHS repeat-associated core domain-containing protein [Marinicella sp. NBU2979]
MSHRTGLIYSLIITLVFSTFITQADEIVVPEAIKSQITTQVMTELGYLDAAEVESRIRLWKLDQTQPRASGELTAQGNCSGNCEQTGGDAALPMPRNVKIKGKQNEGQFTQNLIIKWKRPEALPDGSNLKLKNYRISLSKDGQTFEKYKVKAKFKNNGKPRKHQKLKLRRMEAGQYTVQVRAVYQTTGDNESAQKAGIGLKSSSSGSMWAGGEGGVIGGPDPTTVAGLDQNGALYACIIADGYAQVNGQKVKATDNTYLSDIYLVDCIGGGMTQDDIDDLNLLTGLSTLNITNNPSVTDINGLGQLVLLEYLNISQNPQLDITALEQQKNHFDSLETLVMTNMALTAIPEVPDAVDFLDLSLNQITGNTGGTLPPAVISNAFDSLILDDNEAAGQPTVNDALLSSLSDREIKTISARNSAATDIDLLSGVTNLHNLDLSGAPLAGTQNIENFTGFCALTIQQSQMTKLKPARPIQFLNLASNTELKNIQPTTATSYRPLETSFLNSDQVECHNYYETIDNQATPLTDMTGIQVTMPDGSVANAPACPIINQAAELTAATQCRPNRVQELAVYEDIPSARRYITWQPNSSHDYDRWGVTHYLIQAHKNGALIDQHTQLYDAQGNIPTHVQEHSLEADEYFVQACIGDNCGYNKVDSAAFDQGLRTPHDLNQQWSVNNEYFNISFDYELPPNVNAYPDYFEVLSSFPQADGSYLVATVLFNQSPWITIDLARNNVMGTAFKVRACSDDMGCSHYESIIIEEPVIADPTIAHVQNVTATTNGVDEIILNWDFGSASAADIELVEYIKITEKQPKSIESWDISDGHPPTQGSLLTFNTHKIDGTLKLSRFAWGYYDYTLESCRKVSGEEVCSSIQASPPNAANGHSLLLARTDINANSLPAPIQLESTAETECLDHRGCPPGQLSQSSQLKWQLDPTSAKPDYFLVESVAGSYGQNVPTCQSNDVELQKIGEEVQWQTVTRTYQEFKVDASSLDEDNASKWTSLGACDSLFFEGYDSTHTSTLGRFEVKACINGVGCGEAESIQCDMCETEEPDSGTTFTPIPQGPGALSPGAFWHPGLGGTGWHFFWVNGLSQTAKDGRYGKAYDLVGYWFSFRYLKEEKIWTPAWYEARLSQKVEGSNSVYYQGNLYFHQKQGAVINEIDTGNVQLELGNDNKHATLVLDLDYSHGLFSDEGTSENVWPYERDTLNPSMLRLEINDLALDMLDTDRFSPHNDNDHYSGLWQYGENPAEPISSAEVSLLSWIQGGLENELFAFFDQAGNPIWAYSQSCPQDEIEEDSACNQHFDHEDVNPPINPSPIPPATYFDQFEPESFSQTSTLFTFKQGFNPLIQPHNEWIFEVQREYVGQFGRAFEFDFIQDEENYIDPHQRANAWVKIHTNLATSTPLGSYTRLIKTVDEQGNNSLYGSDENSMIDLNKRANLHGIFYDIVYVDDISVDTCDENSVGPCDVLLTWYTSDEFLNLKPKVQLDAVDPANSTNGMVDLIHLINSDDIYCGGAVPSDMAYEQTLECHFKTPGTYSFELHKPQYESTEETEIIAQYKPLTVIGCQIPGDCDREQIQTPDPQFATLNAELAGTYPGEMTHEPGSGPLPGSGGVSGGAATYELPLTIPPGRNGMQPALSINYSSKGGNGLMGIGWSVSAGSAIYRCGKTIAQDGQFHAVDFSNKDRLCLDGQRLVLVRQNGNPYIDIGDTSSDNAYWSSTAEYRTEMDSFARITPEGANGFKVKTKSGRTNTYEQHGSQQSSWQLVKEQDPYNNSIIYSYQEFGSHEWLLTEIHYTGEGDTLGNRRVEFVTGDRSVNGTSAYSNGYRAGEFSESTRKLDQIRTWVDTSLVRTYDLNYDVSIASQEILLNSVTESVVGANPRTLFEATWSNDDWVTNGSALSYQDLMEGIKLEIEITPTPENLTNLELSLDFNGDGIKDLTYGPKNPKQSPASGLVFIDALGQVRKAFHNIDNADFKYANKFGAGDINSDGVNDLITMEMDYEAQTFQFFFHQLKNDQDVMNGSSNSFFDYFISNPINLTLDNGLFDTDGNGVVNLDDDFDWGIYDLSKMKVDPLASEYYIRDYDQDGKDDLLILVQLRTDPAGNPMSRGDRWNVKNKLIYFKNTSNWTVDTGGGENPNSLSPVFNFNLSFADPEELIGDMEPKFEREDEPGGIRTHVYDKIEFIEDFNGDGMLDVHVKRISNFGLPSSDPNAPMIPEVANERVYFTTELTNPPTPPVAKSFIEMGLSNFMCWKKGALQATPCQAASDPSSSAFGPNSFNFQDVNGDGLKDLLYFDRGIRGEVQDVLTIDDDVIRTWKVRLNQGAPIDTSDNEFVGNLFESSSIDSALATPGVGNSGTYDSYFLPQGNVCSTLDSYTNHPEYKKLARLCNPVFRSGVKQGDINFDGVADLLYPDHDQLLFNRCMTIPSSSNRSPSNEMCDVDDDTCIQATDRLMLNALEHSALHPFVNNRNIELIVTNQSWFFGTGGASCLAGSCVNPPDVQPEFSASPSYGDTSGNLMCSKVSNGLTEVDMYDEAGGYNALWDRGVYGYSALTFRLKNSNELVVEETDKTEFYSTLFWGGPGDLTGDGVTDFHSPMGCMREPEGVELIGCDNSILDTTVLGPNSQFGYSEAQLEGPDGLSIQIKDTNPMADMVTAITKPNTGQQFEWIYTPISADLPGRDDFPLYTTSERADGCDSNPGTCGDGYIDGNLEAIQSYFYFNSSMYVVAEMRQSTGLVEGGLFSESYAVTDSTHYSYEDAVYNNEGRGFQGFRKISVLTEPNHSRELGLSTGLGQTLSVSTFHQLFPRAGKLDTVKSYQYFSDQDRPLIQTTKYNWSQDNESNWINHGVYHYPMRLQITRSFAENQYDEVNGLLSALQEKRNYCQVGVDSIDDYGNILCAQETTTQYTQVVHHETGINGIQTTVNEVETRNNYNNDESTWWVDKLIDSQVVLKKTSDTGDLADGVYDSKTTTTVFNWLADRKLQCQYTLGQGLLASNYQNCGAALDRDDVVKNSFFYDNHGRITELIQSGWNPTTDDPTNVSHRVTQTEYDVTHHDGYFPTKIKQLIDGLELASQMTYDPKTGQVLTSTDANGVVTSNEYDVFGLLKKQTTTDAGGSQLDIPAQTRWKNCYSRDVNGDPIRHCSTQESLLNGLMTNIQNQNVPNPFNVYDSNGYFYTTFYTENGPTHYRYRVPKLMYQTQTFKKGAPMVTTWLDQNGQAVLTQTHHAAGFPSSIGGSTYVLNLVNPLGQTELTTHPFTVDGSQFSELYFTFNNHTERGQLTERLMRVGDVDSSGDANCWRYTSYETFRGQTDVSAQVQGNCANQADHTNHTLLDMHRSYDANGQLRQTVDANNHTTSYWYDAAGNPRVIRDADDNDIVTTFDSLGRKNQVVDPNMGTKTFQYNAFGEVIVEQDLLQAADGVANHMYYDDLGRLRQQYWNVPNSLVPSEGTLAYVDSFLYETLQDGSTCGSLLALCGQTRASSRAEGNSFTLDQTKSYLYDSFGRLVEQRAELTQPIDQSITPLTMADPVYTVKHDYHQTYNLINQTSYHRSGLIQDDPDAPFYAVVNDYTVFGDLYRQTRNPTTESLMEIIEFDAWGRNELQVLGGGVVSEFAYHESTGAVQQIDHHSGHQNFDYAYDAWGNIKRQSLSKQTQHISTEYFNYDKLQRLDDSYIMDGFAQIDAVNYEYSTNGLGNLTVKSDYSLDQRYHDATVNAGPNAIYASLGTANGDIYHEYDLKGNRIHDYLGVVGGTPIATYEFDANNLMTFALKSNNGIDNEVHYRYGLDNARYFKYEFSKDANDAEDKEELTLYGMPEFEELIDLKTLFNRQLKLQIGGHLSVTLRTGINQFEHHYLLKDRLGSTTLIFDNHPQGGVVAEKSYDAFGKPRNGGDWLPMNDPALDFDQDDSYAIDITKRGFTGHEHVDSFELIHMNGRMYDFNNGRFMSVDPFIQGTTSQAINPYSYIQNNPLSGVDPTGYLKKCVGADCPWDDGVPGGPLPGSREWWLKRVSLDNGETGTDSNSKENGDNSELGKFKSGVEGDFKDPEFLKQQFKKHNTLGYKFGVFFSGFGEIIDNPKEHLVDGTGAEAARQIDVATNGLVNGEMVVGLAGVVDIVTGLIEGGKELIQGHYKEAAMAVIVAVVENKSKTLKTIYPGTKEWDEAVQAIASQGKSKSNYRVPTATDAKKLLQESRGNMDRRKEYTARKDRYNKGYEAHNDQNVEELAVGNDLQHIKWKDGRSSGHIFYNDPN